VRETEAHAPEAAEGDAVTPWRQHAADSTAAEIAAYTVIGILALILEHFIGLVDVLMVVVGFAWALYMLSGMAAAVVGAWTDGGIRDAVGALDDRKAIEGIGRGLGVFFAVLILGLAEIVQLHALGGYMPIVAPVLGVAFAWFAVEIAGHISDLFSELGEAVEQAMSRRQKHDRREGEEEDD